MAGSTFFLSGKLGRKGFGKPGGKLVPVWQDRQEAQRYRILDCFDQTIRLSGRVLVETGGQLILIGPDGEAVAQTAARRGDFVADLQPGPVHMALQFVPALRSLLVCGEGEYRQQLLALVDQEQKTHARAMFRTLSPENDAPAVTLAVVQGLRGYDTARRWLEDRLSAAPGGAVSVMDGLYMAPGSYVAKPKIAITGDEAAFQTANDIIAAYIAVARQNEPGILADIDTEFLHDYRVAFRKVRSVVSLFKGVYDDAQTQAFKDAFSQLMAPTGRMRDLDVYLLDRAQYYDFLPATLHEGLTAMFDLFEKERQSEFRKLSRRLRGAAYGKTVQDLADLFDNPGQIAPGLNAELPALEYACALIWKRYRKVCKIAAGIDDTTDDEEVHELRIHCKKLRYLMEFFAPLFPSKQVKPLIKPLKQLQDNLGLFNDYSVQQESLQAFIHHHAPAGRQGDLAIAKSIGALIAVLHQRQLEERARVVSSFAHFDSPEVRGTFRGLFQNKGQ